MTNIRLKIQYDGSRYNGWQRLGSTDNTIQEKLETTLSIILNQDIQINGSGRTDAGVHALAQVANFKLDPSLIQSEYENLASFVMNKANHYLPQNIKIIDCVQADERFHARLNAKSKTYEYRIDNGPVARIFDRKYLTRIEQPLNIELMKKASQYLLGSHDFIAFSSNKHMKKSSVRTITDISITENDGIIVISFTGDGFLYNMVRILVGTLIAVSNGDIAASDIPAILESKDRSQAGPTAPAEGLFLVKVEY